MLFVLNIFLYKEKAFAISILLSIFQTCFAKEQGANVHDLT